MHYGVLLNMYKIITIIFTVFLQANNAIAIENDDEAKADIVISGQVVAKEKKIRVNEPINVVDLIIRAGGLNVFAGQRLILHRSGKDHSYEYDFSKGFSSPQFKKKDGPSGDLLVRPGDKIYITESALFKPPPAEFNQFKEWSRKMAKK